MNEAFDYFCGLGNKRVDFFNFKRALITIFPSRFHDEDIQIIWRQIVGDKSKFLDKMHFSYLYPESLKFHSANSMQHAKK